MFKKILPALTLMFVLTLSFAFRPAPHQKALDGEIYYTWTSGGFVIGDDADLEPCEPGALFCALVFPNGTSGTAAANAVTTFNNSVPVATDYDDGLTYNIGGIDGVIVRKKDSQQ